MELDSAAPIDNALNVPSIVDASEALCIRTRELGECDQHCVAAILYPYQVEGIQWLTGLWKAVCQRFFAFLAVPLC